MSRKYLCKPTPVRLTDPIFYSCCFEHAAHLPPMIDLRPGCSPIVDQGELGSCTANAIASGLREYLLLQAKQPLTRLSRLFLYYEERKIEGTVNEDSGAMIGDGMTVLQKIGVCPETEYLYDISQFTSPPTPQEIHDAAKFKITSYHRVTTLDLAKAALAEGLPVVLGIEVFESFESPTVAKTGIVPLPKKREQLLGGHAVLMIGYDDSKKQAIVRNSWGEGWGDKGYFYLPYTFWSKGLVTDMWTGK